jgi:hypothetical protein
VVEGLCMLRLSVELGEAEETVVAGLRTLDPSLENENVVLLEV